MQLVTYKFCEMLNFYPYIFILSAKCSPQRPLYCYVYFIKSAASKLDQLSYDHVCSTAY